MLQMTHAHIQIDRFLSIHDDEPETGGGEDAVPVPLTTMVSRMEPSGGMPPLFSVERSWHAHDAARCTLCPACTRIDFGEFSACKVSGVGEIADDDAPLYAPQEAISADAS